MATKIFCDECGNQIPYGTTNPVRGTTLYYNGAHQWAFTIHAGSDVNSQPRRIISNDGHLCSECFTYMLKQAKPQEEITHETAG